MWEKKKLISALDKVVDDIMDNYDKYNESEKKEIETFYQSAIDLNKKLEHYDNNKSLWDKLVDAFNNFFGGKK